LCTNRNFLEFLSLCAAFPTRFCLLVFLQVGDKRGDQQPIWGTYKLKINRPSLGNKYPLLSLLFLIVSKPKGVPRACISQSIVNFCLFPFLVCLHLGKNLAKPTILKCKARIVDLISAFVYFTCLPHLSLRQGCVARISFISSYLFITHLCTKLGGFVLHLVHLLWLHSSDLFFNLSISFICLPTTRKVFGQANHPKS
jgi:hypothetical protein